MIALGLSRDSEFIKKVMRAINPQKFGKKDKDIDICDENN